jgi:hypothetical protein
MPSANPLWSALNRVVETYPLWAGGPSMKDQLEITCDQTLDQPPEILEVAKVEGGRSTVF